MTQQRKGWGQLKVGILSATAVLGVAAAILIWGRVGTIHGKKFTLYATTDGARGVIRGTEVWLDGQKIGRVANVEFRPPSIDPAERLVITLHLLKDVQSSIRLDSHAEVRSGGSLLGDQVVWLNSGTPAMRPVADGDTIRSGVQLDIEGMVSDASLATREFPAIMQNLKLLTAQVEAAQGTLAAFGIERGGTNVQHALARTQRLFAALNDSAGTIGLALSAKSNGGGPAFDRAAHAMAQVDSIRALLGSDAHSLGRFQRDSTLSLALQRIRADLVEARRLARNPSGTIGRLRGDTTLLHSVNVDLVAVDSLVSNMKKHPLRYIVF